MDGEKIINKFFTYLKRNGLLKTIIRTFSWMGFYFKKKSILNKSENRQEIFSNIYSKNFWGSKESYSGKGSEILQTSLIRNELPKIFLEHGCSSILDAPCGDFFWMKNVIQYSNIKYIGCDIVKELIDHNQKKFGNKNIVFKHLDICSSDLPNADIMICRDCLIHLSYKDIKNFIKNFLNSEIPLLLLTNHKNYNKKFKNKDIQTGDFRFIDIFREPFGFPEEVIYRFDDYVEPGTPKEMCLFTKEQIKQASINET